MTPQLETPQSGQTLSQPLSNRRVTILVALLAAAALAIVARLFQFHVFLHGTQDTAGFVDRNLTETPTRGVILDARGDLLTGDVWTYRLVVPRLEQLSPLYRESLTLLLTGIGGTPRAELADRIAEALNSYRKRHRAEVSRAQEAGQSPSRILAYLVLEDELHLAQGEYLERLQRQGVSAANLWKLHRAGDENALKSLQELLDEELSVPGMTGPALGQMMAELGLRSNLQERETDFEFFRSFRLEPVPTRFYTHGSLASHVLGLVNVDRQGVNGLESYYQRFLRGEVQFMDTLEPLGALTPGARRYIPSLMGGDLVLTIDRSIQRIVEQELALAIERYDVRKGGIAIVLEPQTGAVLAMANKPDFDPGALHRNDEDPNAYTNLAVTGVYEPGSVLKVLTMATALDLEVVQPQDVFYDIGEYEMLPQAVVRNSENRIVGRVTATEALAYSLNTVIVQIAMERIGPEDFYEYMFNFGLGEVSGIDLAHEFNGSLKDKHPELDNWNITDLGTNSFGQGLNLTPIQMVNAINTVANGGKLMKPYVVRHRVQEEGIQSFQPTILDPDVIRPETSSSIAEMMTFTVDRTVTGAQVAGYRVAGKSGTAQVPDPERIGQYSEDAVISSFAGFAPADDPKFVILIVLNEPRPINGIPAWGARNAAPTFGRIAARVLDYMNVPPACHPACYGSRVEPQSSSPIRGELPLPGQASA